MKANDIQVGWDGGRMYDKIRALIKGNFTEASSINACCKGFDRRVLEREDGNPMDYLDVDIYEGDNCMGRFFVGDMAYRENRGDLITSSNSIKKFDSNILDYEKARMLTHMAYLNFESEVKSKSTVSAYVGTGVPVEEFFDASNKKSLISVKKELGRKYKVIFNHHTFNNYELDIDIEKVELSSEGAATAITTKTIVNEELKLYKNTEVIKKLGKIYLILNLGSSTFDVAILDNGKFTSIGLMGIPLGSSTLLKNVINDLAEISGYKPDKVTMDKLLMTTDRIRYKGEQYNIRDIAKARYKDVVAQIKVALLNELELRGIEFTTFDGVYISGGLVKTLNNIDESILKNLLPIPTVISEDPIYDEANGYMINAIEVYLKDQEALEKTLNIKRADVIDVVEVG